MKVYQDGNVFYNDETGDVVFVSSIVVKDFDLEAAKLARQEYQDWANRNDVDIEFV